MQKDQILSKALNLRNDTRKVWKISNSQFGMVSFIMVTPLSKFKTPGYF